MAEVHTIEIKVRTFWRLGFIKMPKKVKWYEFEIQVMSNPFHVIITL